MINRAKGASNLNTEWNHVLGSYRDSKDPLDVIVIDYLMTAFDHPRSKTAVRLLQKYLESWKRPPALVFLETITAYDMINMFQDQRPCDYVKDMDTCRFFEKKGLFECHNFFGFFRFFKPLVAAVVFWWYSV